MSKKLLLSIILFSIVCFFNCNDMKAASMDPGYQIKRAQSSYTDTLGYYYEEFPQYDSFFIPYFFIPKNPNEEIPTDYSPGEEDTFITPEYTKANNVKWYKYENYGSAEIDDNGYLTITSFANDPYNTGKENYYLYYGHVRCELTTDSGEIMKSDWVSVIIMVFHKETVTADITIVDPIPAPDNKPGITWKTKTTYITINTIEPPTLSLSLKKLAKNKVKLTWKSKSGTSLKKRSDLSGYQIKYWWKKSKKTSKKYIRKIKKYSKITTIFKKLKKNRKYYFKVRAYKKNSTTLKTYYGKWSKTKSVKIKNNETK